MNQVGAGRPAANQLGMFAKFWQPGSVKTRLAAEVGPIAASSIYRAFVTALARRLEGVAARRVLAFSPPDRRADFAMLLGELNVSWELEDQGPGDLGARMHHYFTAAFDRDASRVVLIGSDSPTIPGEFIQRAFELLDQAPVVLGPASDGGYYLIGLAGAVPPVFEGISWSSPAVWDQTVSKLEQALIPYATLPPWYDVDDLQDLRRLAAELAADGGSGAVARELAENLHAAWPAL